VALSTTAAEDDDDEVAVSDETVVIVVAASSRLVRLTLGPLQNDTPFTFTLLSHKRGPIQLHLQPIFKDKKLKCSPNDTDLCLT